MASKGFSLGHSGPSYPFDSKPLPSCAKHHCKGHSCITTERNPEQQCTQECKHGECMMECHGQHCHQHCNTGSSNCSLKCHDSNQQCEQECNRGECKMECHGQNCHQHCDTGSSKCSLECHDIKQQCTRTCNHGECKMECNGRNCHQHCNAGTSKRSLGCHDSNLPLIADGSNQCQQTCFADDNKRTSTAATMKKTTLARALRTASVRYHTCRHYCTGEWSNCSSFFPSSTAYTLPKCSQTKPI